MNAMYYTLFSSPDILTISYAVRCLSIYSVPNLSARGKQLPSRNTSRTYKQQNQRCHYQPDEEIHCPVTNPPCARLIADMRVRYDWIPADVEQSYDSCFTEYLRSASARAFENIAIVKGTVDAVVPAYIFTDLGIVNRWPLQIEKRAGPM